MVKMRVDRKDILKDTLTVVQKVAKTEQKTAEEGPEVGCFEG